MSKRKRVLSSLLIGVAVGVVLFGINSLASRSVVVPDPYPQNRQSLQTVPQVESCVPKVKVRKTEIVDAGTAEPSLVLELENDSNIGILAISVESVKGKESYETTLRSSFAADQTPIVVIKPHEVGTIRAAMSNLFAGVPLRISGVIYADGTEAGCDRGLKTLHQVKDDDRTGRNRKEPRQ